MLFIIDLVNKRNSLGDMKHHFLTPASIFTQPLIILPFLIGASCSQHRFLISSLLLSFDRVQHRKSTNVLNVVPGSYMYCCIVNLVFV